MRRLAVGVFLVLTCTAVDAVAQTEGSIRGYVRDEQGGVLPGVTMTVTSADTGKPRVAVSDQEGYYRLLNVLPLFFIRPLLRVPGQCGLRVPWVRERRMSGADSSIQAAISPTLTRRLLRTRGPSVFSVAGWR